MQDGQYDRCLMVHPSHRTMQEEYDAWVGYRRYSQEYADHALATLQRMGYDMQYQGLFQACFEVVRNNKINNEITSRPSNCFTALLLTVKLSASTRRSYLLSSTSTLRNARRYCLFLKESSART